MEKQHNDYGSHFSILVPDIGRALALATAKGFQSTTWDFDSRPKPFEESHHHHHPIVITAF